VKEFNINLYNLLSQKFAFTTRKDFEEEPRETQHWALAQRLLHGLHPPEVHTPEVHTPEVLTNRYLGDLTEQARRRAEIARYYYGTTLLDVLYFIE
jgi:H+-transporting ATPase